MDVNDDEGCLNQRGALTCIASRLAPTEGTRATLANRWPTSEVGTIWMLIGRDRSHGSIVRPGVREHTETLSAAPAFTTRKPP